MVYTISGGARLASAAAAMSRMVLEFFWCLAPSSDVLRLRLAPLRLFSLPRANSFIDLR
jgi:hypothetical protein